MDACRSGRARFDFWGCLGGFTGVTRNLTEDRPSADGKILNLQNICYISIFYCSF
jgi:hypothetical protein